MASVLTQAESLQRPLTKAGARCVLVLFGASGDLTKRKLVPALFNLAKANLLPDNFAILGVAFDELGIEQFRDQVTSFLQWDDKSSDALESFKQRLYYQRADFADSEMYPALQERALNRVADLQVQHRRQLSFLSGNSAEILRSDRPATGTEPTFQTGEWPLAAGGD